jgi:hypothetical protein
MTDNQRNVFGVIMLSVVMLSALAPHFTHIFCAKILLHLIYISRINVLKFCIILWVLNFAQAGIVLCFLPNSVCHLKQQIIISTKAWPRAIIQNAE